MRNNKGLTFIEVLLKLFVFSIILLTFNKHCLIINKMKKINTINHEMGIVAKNKMEEIKSGYIYIDDNRHFILDLGESITFEEQNYNIKVSIKPLNNHRGISQINLEISNNEEDISYNLIRYIDLCNITTGKQ